MGWGFLSVFMCNFCCIPWKEYFKENMYNILFCVLKQRGNCLSSLGHLCRRMWEECECFVLAGVYTLTPLCHHPSPNHVKRWAAFEAQQGYALTMEQHGHSAGPDGIAWSGQNSRGLGLPPCKGGGFCKGPDLSGLLKINQRQLLTAPRTPLGVTQWQMVFLPFYDYKWFFEKSVLETEDF